MIDRLLQVVAPHHCCGCDKIGTLLCQNCKYDIISEPFSACVACGAALWGGSGICPVCTTTYDRAWCVGQRQDHLQRLIDNYKFMNMKSAHRDLAELLHLHLPPLPSSVVIVPIPTVPPHIRERGYDHMVLIARYFAKKRQLQVKTVLQRATNTKQRDAGRRQRTAQAKEAFYCNQQLSDELTYLLLDDVVTTGATMKYAAKTLKEAGASTVWVASISRQTLD